MHRQVLKGSGGASNEARGGGADEQCLENMLHLRYTLSHAAALPDHYVFSPTQLLAADRVSLPHIDISGDRDEVRAPSSMPARSSASSWLLSLQSTLLANYQQEHPVSWGGRTSGLQFCEVQGVGGGAQVGLHLAPPMLKGVPLPSK
jgi:hypothetical protein